MTTSDADLITQYPVLQQVKNTVDAALANAKVVGDQPVGKISADITTAYKGGAYTGGKYAGGERDERGKESTLGDLVANALRDGIPATQGKADLGIVNPGGLRDELLYAGEPAANPANTDGVVTYAEANKVLPFVNNVWLVQLTGAQLKAVLEQQWQPAGARPPVPRTWASPTTCGSPRTPGKPVGKRITSVLVNGVKTTPKKTYTVSTFSSSARAATTSPPSRPARPRTPAWSTATCGSATCKGAGTDLARLRPAAGRGEEPEDAASSPTRSTTSACRQPRPDVARQPAEHRGGRLRDHAGQGQAGPGEAGRVPGQATAWRS